MFILIAKINTFFDNCKFLFRKKFANIEEIAVTYL
jgi:hypothetical protein